MAPSGRFLTITAAVGPRPSGSQAAQHRDKRSTYPSAASLPKVSATRQSYWIDCRLECGGRSRPMVIFAREITDDLASLVTQVDDVVAKTTDEEMACQ